MHKIFDKVDHAFDKAKSFVDEQQQRHMGSSNQSQQSSQYMQPNQFQQPGASQNQSQQPMGTWNQSQPPMGNSTRPVYPQPGGPPGPGVLPLKVASTKYHDKMRFCHPKGHQHDVLCDLGFSGVIDGKIVWTFGDTLMGTEEKNFICATDSIAMGNMADPMTVCNTALCPGSDNIKEWIPPNEQEEADGGISCYAYGGTNIVEYAPNQGLVYYLKIHRPGGVAKVHGAGVATVRMNGDVPEATRAGDHMWNDCEPNWGDVGITYNSQDGMVYAYGHGPSTDGELGARTYLCRAPALQATDVNKYEYWNNDKKEWTTARFADGNFGSLKCAKEHCIFDWLAMNQAAPFWSNYYNKWMLLHGDSWTYSDVIAKTADKLEGPWTDHGVVATTKPEGHGDGFRYACNGHPEFDPTGKTVLVTWTRNNVIWGVTIEWE